MAPPERDAPAQMTPDPVAADRVPLDRAALGRLRWRCRLGMRELDELLTRYVDEHYATDSAAHRAAFRQLLDSHDPWIYAYFLGHRTPSDPALSSLIAHITAAARNS